LRGHNVLFLFNNFALDCERRELRADDTSVSVEPQVFDLLVYLIKNRDRVVSKDDLIASVWGGRIVSESTLTSRINAARKAVGDNGKEQRLIRTSARKGFRFVGDVQEQHPPAVDDVNGAATGNKTADAHPPLIADRPSIAVLRFEEYVG
jgi:DNA-binding winged helix-turn-helix (wHTH) protein